MRTRHKKQEAPLQVRSETQATYIVTVHKPPTHLVNPIIQRGFTNTDKIKAWAEKNGHKTVYWLASKETVYVERKATHGQKA